MTSSPAPMRTAMMRLFLSLTLLHPLSLTALTAFAQCTGHWINDPQQAYPGAHGAVHALVEWDPDGAGPLAPWLVVAGEFNIAGTANSYCVAAWDGANWHALGTGMDLPVYCLAVYNGDLYAGGIFNYADGNGPGRLARWDGTAWRGVGNFRSPTTGRSTSVKALAVRDGELIVGGVFDTVSGVTTNNIARWDGANWLPLGNGVAGNLSSPGVFVSSLAVLPGGDLVAGGNFFSAGDTPANNIARWDGSGWHALQNGLGAAPNSMTVFSNRLIAGGPFPAQNHLSQWDGANWTPFDPGSNPTYVNSITVHHGELIVGANFDPNGAPPLAGVARWTGSAWTPVGNTPPAAPYVLTPYMDQLYAGGNFSSADDSPAIDLAVWDGQRWSPLAVGFNSTINTFYNFGQDLIAGGKFTAAGGQASNWTARWDGTSWNAMPGLRTDSGAGVYSFAEFQGSLIAGGSFGIQASAYPFLTARWDGATWQESDFSCIYSGTVYTLANYHNELVAGGTFVDGCGSGASYLARWDGQTTRALGRGVTGSEGIRALTIFQDRLIVAGAFHAVSDASIGYIASWSGGELQPIGPPVNTVHGFTAVCEFRGELIATGFHFRYPGFAADDYIAAWNGASWRQLGLGLNNDAYSVAVYNDRLIAVGAFTAAGGAPANYIAAWDGGNWHPLADGLQINFDPYGAEYVATVAVNRNQLVVGGGIVKADGEVSAYWARWQSATCGSCPGDANCDCAANIADLALVLSNFGETGVGPGQGDLDANSVVDLSDLALILINYGATCP